LAQQPNHKTARLIIDPPIQTNDLERPTTHTTYVMVSGGNSPNYISMHKWYTRICFPILSYLVLPREEVFVPLLSQYKIR